MQLIQIHPYLIWQKKQRKPATRKKSSARKAVDSRMEKVTEEEVLEKKKVSIRKVVGYFNCPIRCRIFLVEVMSFHASLRT